METDKPHLTLVDDQFVSDHDQEFVPLPYYAWDERPATLALDHEECATAIHIAQGDLPAAASLLKIPLTRLTRSLRASPRLQRILQEAHETVIHRAAGEYIKALDAPSDRRREWAASKLLATRAAAQHPFAPAPPSTSASLALTEASNGSKTLTFRWRTDADDLPDDVA